MMVNTAASFIFSIFTFYSFYRYIVDQSDFFKETAILHFDWQIYYLASALVVIRSANQLANEVNIINSNISNL